MDEHKPLGRVLVTVFVAIHIVAITLWVFPVNASLTRLVHRCLGPYFSLMGLRQEWSLFSPDPIVANSYVDAQVVLENGDVRTWSFPVLASLPFGERYQKARYRKFEGWLYRKSYSYAWRDTARYVARQFQQWGTAPRTVKLVRHWARIPPINAGSDRAPEWHSIVFFVYEIPPGEVE